MRWFLILMLSVMTSLGATTYTEFYCDASVSANNTNVNAGSTTGGPVYGPSVNGNWDGTSVFTPTDGSTPASTVSAGMWASVYLDAATVAVYIAQVTNVAAGANGAITLSQAAFMGSKPAAGATGRTIRVGGCWKGPHGTEAFPFGFAATTATNFSQNMPCVNLQNASIYAVTAAMTHNVNGPVRFQGYSSTPRDGGKATIDGGTAGNSYILFTLSGNDVQLLDLIFSNNGTTSTATDGVVISGIECGLTRIVVHDMMRSGFAISGGGAIINECEAYLCDKANSTLQGGFNNSAAPAYFTRCISHDNTSAQAVGFFLANPAFMQGCVADSNGKNGATISSSTYFKFLNCDFYNNNTNGVEITATTTGIYDFENCNFIKNGQYGIDSTGGGLRVGSIVNCGFGAGTQKNGVNDIDSNIGGMNIVGSITYPNDVTPWVDPANGDFRINLTQAKAAGRGSFTETQASYTGTVAYPDVGAGQSASTNSAVSGGSWTFSQ